jgi:hypothetical protein
MVALWLLLVSELSPFIVVSPFIVPSIIVVSPFMVPAITGDAPAQLSSSAAPPEVQLPPSGAPQGNNTFESDLGINHGVLQPTINCDEVPAVTGDAPEQLSSSAAPPEVQLHSSGAPQVDITFGKSHTNDATVPAVLILGKIRSPATPLTVSTLHHVEMIKLANADEATAPTVVTPVQLSSLEESMDEMCTPLSHQILSIHL